MLRYEGLMKDGQCHGKGVFQYADGDRCARGEQRGVCGVPVFVFTHAAALPRYEGEYVEGQMNGLGVYRWSNGRCVVWLGTRCESPALTQQ